MPSATAIAARAATAEPRSARGDAAILLYDGECGFCQASIQRVLELDRPERRRGPTLRFAPLQGATAAPILGRHGITPDAAKGFDTVILALAPGTPRERLVMYSDAVMAVLRYLGGPWGWLGLLGGLLPRPLRDAGYRLIAMNRLRIAGRVDACRIPKKDERARFLP